MEDKPQLALELGDENEGKDVREDVVDDDEDNNAVAEAEEDEEDEDDDDDDDEGAGSSKGKRGRDDISRFIALEAEASDGDEEDEGEVEEGFEELVKEAQQITREGGATHRLMNSIKDFEDNLGDAAALEERFGYYDAGDGESVATEMIPSHGLQPSIRDPRMWMVKCKPGKEREAVVAIMHRYFLKRELQQTLPIMSVVAPEHTKGFIFVEGEKEPLIRAAIHGISNLFTYQSQLVPLDQVTSVLRVTNQTADLKPGDWVRVKRGTYMNDLAQVYEVDPSGLRATVKLIPRLDTGDEEEEAAPATKGRKKSKNALNRPKQRLFNPDEVNRRLGMVRQETVRGVNFYILNNDRFGELGYLYKDMACKSLITQDVKPSLDELQAFQSALTATGDRGDGASLQQLTQEERLVKLASLANIKRGESVFVKGDTVKVVEGGEKGLVGTVRAVNGSTVTVDIKAPGASLVEQFNASQLIKHFQVGDHVKVLSGEFKDQTGFISNVVDEVVSVMDDSTLKTFQVLRHDIQKSVSVATGQLRLGNYALHDLVRLTDSRTVGVIVKIERESFQVLDQTGTVHHIELPNMGAKVNQRDPVSMDKNQAQVSQGDMLKVVDGPSKGKQGKVIHIYRFFAFLECREVLANGGIVAAKTDHCLLVGASSNKRRPGGAFGANLLLMSPRSTSQQGPEDSQLKLARQHKRDPMIGQTVTMIKGPYKAFRGVVRDISNGRLRVELQANRKTVSVHPDEVGKAGKPGEGMGASADPSRDLQGWDGNNAGWQTPSAAAGGMMTPFRPQTPATPGHGDEGGSDYWNPNVRTPARADNNWDREQDEQQQQYAGGPGGSSADSMGWTPTSDADMYRAYVPGGPQQGGYSSSGGFSGAYSDPSAPTPYTGYPAPTPGAYTGTPGYGAGTPGYTPGYGAGTPGYGAGTPGYGAGTPGYGAGTPGYAGTSTPGYGAPLTPGAFAGTPGYAATPGGGYPGGYSPAPYGASPHPQQSPAGRFAGGYDLKSPAPGYTPHIGSSYSAGPMTPSQRASSTPSYGNFTPGYGTPGAGVEGLHHDWHRPNVVVELTRTKERGVIETVGHSTCNVRLDGEGTQEVSKADLKVVEPNTGDKIIVLGGQQAGFVGDIAAIDSNKECLVQFPGANMAMIPRVLLGKWAL